MALIWVLFCLNPGLLMDRSQQYVMNSSGRQSADADIEYSLLAWIKASERKKTILQELSNSPQNSSYFAEQWEISTEGVNYHLKQLQQGGPNKDSLPLIQVLTPERQQYQLYGLTDVGMSVLNDI